MSQHFTYINKFKGKLSGQALKMEDAADRSLVLQIAVKCGDLNNPAKDVALSKIWTYRVMDEFFKQVMG